MVGVEVVESTSTDVVSQLGQGGDAMPLIVSTGNSTHDVGARGVPGAVTSPSESISTCTDAGAQLGQEGSAMPLSEYDQGDCDQSNKKRKADGHLSLVGLGLTGKNVHPWPNQKEIHTGNWALIRRIGEILQSIALARNKSDEPLHIPDSDVNLRDIRICDTDEHLVAFSKDQVSSLINPQCADLSSHSVVNGSGSRPARFYMEYEEEDNRVRSGSSDLSVSVLTHWIVRHVPRSGSHWADVGGMFALRMLVVLESQKAGVPLEKDAILHFVKKAFPTTVGKLEFYRIMVSLDPLFPGRYFSWWWIFHPEEYSKTPHERVCSDSRARRAMTPILPPYSANEETFFSDSVGSVHGGFRSSYTFHGRSHNRERLEWYSPTFRTKEEAAIWSKIARTQFVLLIGAMSTPLVGKSGIMGFLNECSIYALRVVIRKYGSYLEDCAAHCLKCSETLLYHENNDGYIHRLHCPSCPMSTSAAAASSTPVSLEYKSIDECIQMVENIQLGDSPVKGEIEGRWERFLSARSVHQAPHDDSVMDFVSENVGFLATQASYHDFILWMDSMPPSVSLRCREDCVTMVTNASQAPPTAGQDVGSAMQD
ncbi:hypothetical protein THAOC_01430 [Thalassiosira oceanica]|uniref:Uncharacterized protein n=1 Tax=Thalassiosira oceanica TaxID=159749 RepID=K0TN33_THAOC|nr:hypothetical protein THAOC_01430 [Thalassiosira oceanica]|eukprot:EJK76791.1 hypothetical protein THAOC_01430 [Thalassiosira oceanica]